MSSQWMMKKFCCQIASNTSLILSNGIAKLYNLFLITIYCIRDFTASSTNTKMNWTSFLILSPRNAKHCNLSPIWVNWCNCYLYTCCKFLSWILSSTHLGISFNATPKPRKSFSIYSDAVHRSASFIWKQSGFNLQQNCILWKMFGSSSAKTDVLHTPSLTRPAFESMASRSWKYRSNPRDAHPNHSAIKEFSSLRFDICISYSAGRHLPSKGTTTLELFRLL